MLPPGHPHSALYQQAIGLAKEMYRITDGFPDSERAVLVFTLRRATVFLCQHLAAAAVARPKKQKRHLEAGMEQCVSIDAQLEVAVAVGLVGAGNVAAATHLLHEIYQHVAAQLLT